MSVPSGKRKPSSVEFDNSYYRVHDDVCDMVANGFYAPADELFPPEPPRRRRGRDEIIDRAFKEMRMG